MITKNMKSENVGCKMMLFLGTMLLVSFVSAWTVPTVPPTGINADGPITIGTSSLSSQTRTGRLQIVGNTFLAGNGNIQVLKLGTSAVSGRILIADEAGFGTWSDVNSSFTATSCTNQIITSVNSNGTPVCADMPPTATTTVGGVKAGICSDPNTSVTNIYSGGITGCKKTNAQCVIKGIVYNVGDICSQAQSGNNFYPIRCDATGWTALAAVTTAPAITCGYNGRARVNCYIDTNYSLAFPLKRPVPVGYKCTMFMGMTNYLAECTSQITPPGGIIPSPPHPPNGLTYSTPVTGGPYPVCSN